MTDIYPVLVAVCAAVVVLGLWGAGYAIRGRPAGANAFRNRSNSVRTSGALTITRTRLPRIGVAVVAGLLVYLITGWPVGTVFTTALILTVPYFFGGGRIAAAQIARLEGLEQWTRHLSDAMAVGGMPVQTIIRSAETAPEVIRADVTRLADRFRTPRLDKTEALLAFADDIDDSLGDVVAIALTTTVDAHGGARVPFILQTLAEAAADEVKARRSMEKNRTGPRKEVQTIVMVLAAGVTALALFTDYAKAYDDVEGQVVLAALCGLVLLALTMMRPLSVGGQPPRILPQRSSRQTQKGQS